MINSSLESEIKNLKMEAKKASSISAVTQKAEAAKNNLFNYYLGQAFGQWLGKEDITEICINRPNEVWLLIDNQWRQEKIIFDLDDCHSLAMAIATNRQASISDNRPLLSSALISGERVQIARSPATLPDILSFTIRIPSKKRFTMENYKSIGFFENIRRYGEKKEDVLLDVFKSGHYAEFLELAVKLEKNIVIAGETNSGKTTFMKMLIDFIPEYERLITIEDTNEISFLKHQNYVHLFYPSEAKTEDFLTASSLLKSCLRMNPDRILLAELRGGESFDFINVLTSGHGGSITSLHAGSVDETFDRICMMMRQNKQGSTIPYEETMKFTKKTIDVIVHIDGKNGQRNITEIYYKNALDNILH